MSKTTRTPPNLCLNCGKVIDSATGPGDHRPTPGMIAVCFYCGHVMAFDAALRLRPLTDEEMAEVASDERILAIQAGRGIPAKRLQ
jgi:DNA-directed RNA polymerase subunit N (RpoN/RPB10)